MTIGATEILVVLIIALLVFGPGRLPQLGRSLGRGLREFKQAASTARSELGIDQVVSEVKDVKDDITTSLGVDDIKASLRVDDQTPPQVSSARPTGTYAKVGTWSAEPPATPAAAATAEEPAGAGDAAPEPDAGEGGHAP
jgi:TatA/E family protein of Tat protein translocase